MAPELVQDLFPGENPAFLGGQEAQDLEFRGGQIKGAPLPPDFEAFRVQDEAGPDLQDGRALVRLGPAQDGFNPRGQLFQGKGLGDVIVGPQLEAQNLVRLFGFGRSDDDRNGPPIIAPFEGLADIQPAHVREHQVEQDQVRSLPLQKAKEPLGVAEDFHAEALLAEMRGNKRGQVRLVFNESDEIVHGEGNCGSLFYISTPGQSKRAQARPRRARPGRRIARFSRIGR